MNIEITNEEKQEKENLIRICRKIVQAYRIRLMCLNKRHQLLLSIDHNFNNISNPNFFRILDTILKRERKVLKISRREDVGAESNILYALNQLEKHKKGFGLKLGEDFIVMNRNQRIKIWNIMDFLEECIEFLNLMQNDLGKIEQRIHIEEKFLEMENRNPEYFNKFILAWDDEIKANQKFMKHFKKVINRSKRVITWGGGESGGGAEIVGGTIGGAAAILVGVSIGAGPVGIGIGVSIGAAIVMVGLFIKLMDTLSNSFDNPNGNLGSTKKDEQLLKHIEEMKGIKKPFWKKLF